MILTVDIGNTSIACGLFDNDKLVKKFRMPSNSSLTATDFEKLLTSEIVYSVEGGIIGSVYEGVNNAIISALKNSFGFEPVILSYKSKMPIKLTIGNYHEIGADRIANGVRAYNLFPNKPAIVVDYGTATTFDIINSKGEFVGGLIAPGIRTQLNSLNLATDKLPKVEIDDIKTAIGNNTKDCILAGVIQGTACMTEGMIEKCEAEMGEKAIVIITGGFSDVITKYIKRKVDLISPDFTLEGLRDLYYIN